MKPGSKKTYFRIAAILLSICFGLAVAEVSFRAYLSWTFRGDISDDPTLAPSDTPDSPDSERVLYFQDLVYRVENERLIYRTRPNISGYFKHVHIETNELGFRDKPLRSPKPSNAFRIVGVGDSSMFGWGVTPDEMYVNLLEAAFQDTGFDHIEIVNTAAPGYTTTQEIELLTSELDRLDPDLVLIQYDLNDAHLAEFLFSPNFCFTRTPYIQFLPLALKGRLADPSGPFMKRIRRNQSQEMGNRLGWDSVRRGYQTLDRLCQEKEINVLVIIPPMTHSQDFHPPHSDTDPYSAFRKLMRELEMPFVDTYAALPQFLEASNMTWKDLVLENNDRHPNALGHALIARETFPVLAEMLGVQSTNPIRIPVADSQMIIPISKIDSHEGVYSGVQKWSGVEVMWASPTATLQLEAPSDHGWCRFFIRHEDVSEQNPVTVLLSIDGKRVRTLDAARQGLHELPFRVEAGETFELKLEVSRSFTTPTDGRTLALALYPLVFR